MDSMVWYLRVYCAGKGSTQPSAPLNVAVSVCGVQHLGRVFIRPKVHGAFHLHANPRLILLMSLLLWHCPATQSVISEDEAVT